MSVYLKVKIKALAAESKIIRIEERNTLRQTRRQRKQGSEDRVRHLVYQYQNLHEHRVGRVRRASRSAQLAYGFVRGNTHEQMERNRRTEPDWPEVGKMVRRYGKLDGDNYPPILVAMAKPVLTFGKTRKAS